MLGVPVTIRPWTFVRPNGGHVAVSAPARATFEAYRQRASGHLEAGGVLLGRLIRETADVVIDFAAEPGKGDHRERQRFVRDCARAQKLVDAAWRASAGTAIYLGEWHSHPEGVPSPSAHDVAGWVRIATSARYEQAFLVFIIVGIADVGCWETDSRTGRVVRLPGAAG